MSGKLNIKKSSLVALDTNIFIYQFEKHPRFGPKTNAIFSLLSENQLRAVTNIVSLIELLSLSAPKEKIAGLHDLYERTPNLETVEVGQSVGLETARIRRKYCFRLPDSIQLATALISKADLFITNDKRLKKFKELKAALLTELKL